MSRMGRWRAAIALAIGALAAGFALAGCGSSEGHSFNTAGAPKRAQAASGAARTGSHAGSEGGSAPDGGTTGSGRGAAARRRAQTASSQNAAPHAQGRAAVARSARGGGGRTAGRSERHAGSVQPAETASGEGLSVAPGIFEHTANRGSVGSLKISNTTSVPMTVKVVLRPWAQAPSGEVSPNRHHRLADVRLTASSFALPARASRTIGFSLRRIPRGRSLYGAIEVTGAPHRKARGGVKLAYRLVSSLRLDPPKRAQSFHAKAGRLVEHGSIGHGTLLLAVRNRGNTIVPIGGSVHIGCSGHSLSAKAKAKMIVPGRIVNVPLAELPGTLSRGRCTVTVALTQGGHGLGTVRRTMELR
jgi:hypothetical protein